jgi:hypothetical protein
MWRLFALLLEIIIFLGNLRKLAFSSGMKEWADYRTSVAIDVASKAGIIDVVR